MIKYPIEFHSRTEAACGLSRNWQTLSQDRHTEVSVPKEFLGPGSGLSPEDLYNHALTNCFVATFQVYAENSKLSFESLKVESKLIVDVDERKRPVMKEFFLSATIQAPNNSEKALLLARKASESGFILNSVKTICHFDFKVS